MKAKLEYCLRWLREGAVRVVRSYPVETLLALYACIRCLLTYELDWSEEELFNRLGLVPLFFALALAVNNLAGRGPWRKVYWVVWAPIVPLTLWSGLGDWIESASFRISLGILAPLLLLLSLRFLHLLLSVFFILQEGIQHLLSVILAHLFLLLRLLFLCLILLLIILLLLLILVLLLLILFILIFLLVLVLILILIFILLILLIVQQFLCQSQIITCFIIFRIQAQRLFISFDTFGILFTLHANISDIMVNLSQASFTFGRFDHLLSLSG